MNKLKVYITAGEASGDTLGAQLMRSLKQSCPLPIEFYGVGGDQMQAEGMHSLFPMRELSVMGITEVLPKAAKILKRIRQTADHVLSVKPDIFLTIDSPDFSMRVASKLKGRIADQCLRVHYVSPTIWAWRPERAKKVASLYDQVLCLYPFEPECYKDVDVEAHFVGHSVLNSGVIEASGKPLRDKLSIPEYEPVLGVLFGSRMGELNRTGPVLHQAACEIAKEVEGLNIISLTMPHLQSQAQNLLESIPCKTHLITDMSQKWPVFKAMDAAIAVSGTVGLELAVANVPHLIGYRMNKLTWKIVQRKVSIKYAHLANILQDDGVVPEFIQDECQPEIIAKTATSLLRDESKRKLQKENFEEVRNALQPENRISAADAASQAILSKFDLGITSQTKVA